MAKQNVQKSLSTHEGGMAKRINAGLALRRSVLACLLWERTFYEGGVEIADRISQLVPQVDAEKVAALAVEARSEMHLRHAPLWIVRQMALHKTHRGLVGDTLGKIIQRPDEMAEFLALYWLDGKQPLSAQVKRGLATAFGKFDEYQLAKYDRPGKVRLRDVLFLCHAKPKDAEQEALWKQLIDGELSAPDTWEVALSGGADKRAAFERLMAEERLGGLAFLRNLRNMLQADVPVTSIREYMKIANFRRVLPFRFIAAAKYAPQLEPELEDVMLRSLDEHEKLAGETILLVDVSGSLVKRHLSMVGPLSAESDMARMDAACGLGIILREVCEHVRVFTFSNELVEVAPRRGFALRDAITGSQPHRGTYLGAAVRRCPKHDRLIVFTDEQSHDTVPDPTEANSYMVNVASHQNGVGYGAWTHLDGFSEAVIRWLVEYEKFVEQE